MAGTAACPSDTWFTPAHVLERLHEIGGLPNGDIAPPTGVAVAAPGVDSMLGAEPETVTDSLTSGAMVTTNSVAASSASIRIGLE